MVHKACDIRLPLLTITSGFLGYFSDCLKFFWSIWTCRMYIYSSLAYWNDLFLIILPQSSTGLPFSKVCAPVHGPLLGKPHLLSEKLGPSLPAWPTLLAISPAARLGNYSWTIIGPDPDHSRIPNENLEIFLPMFSLKTKWEWPKSSLSSTLQRESRWEGRRMYECEFEINQHRVVACNADTCIKLQNHTTNPMEPYMD